MADDFSDDQKRGIGQRFHLGRQPRVGAVDDALLLCETPFGDHGDGRVGLAEVVAEHSEQGRGPVALVEVAGRLGGPLEREDQVQPLVDLWMPPLRSSRAAVELLVAQATEVSDSGQGQAH